jgi:hypothetical protein
MSAVERAILLTAKMNGISGRSDSSTSKPVLTEAERVLNEMQASAECSLNATECSLSATECSLNVKMK